MITPYNPGLDILTSDHGSDNFVKISPSSISKFFEHPRSWWGENFLDEPGFEGSTASVLGSIIHHNAEQAAKGLPLATEEEVLQYLLDNRHLDLNRDDILANYDTMSDVLISSCIEDTKFHSLEEFIHHQIIPSIYIAGTYDAIRPTGNGNFTLRDYKTASAKPQGISYGYRMQLHTYAYILRQQGINIDYIELEYVVKPTKTLPARHFSFKEPFTEEDYLKIESQLKTVAHSIKLWQEQPDLRWALAQDYRLFKEKPILFT